MPHDMPLFNLVLNSERVNALGHALQVIGIVWLNGRVTQSGKVERKACEPAGHSFDDAAPQLMAGGYSMNEQDGLTGTAAKYVHIQTWEATLIWVEYNRFALSITSIQSCIPQHKNGQLQAIFVLK
jgi:hypothetical protein